jgi:GntR family transcriptional regulator/MocR family aminotransferase
MDLHVTLEGTGDLADRIYRQLAAAVRDGRMRPGEALPPTRELARRLEVSRTTVTAAYDRLLAEGLTTARVGSGTFVSEQLRRDPVTRGSRRGVIRPLAFWRNRLSSLDGERPLAYDFGVGVPDVALFPLAAWRRCVAAELGSPRMISARYGNPAGRWELRAAIARHIGLSRSVLAEAEDVVVTNGAQQAIALVARILIRPGDVVAVEEPGYPPVRSLLESVGARVVGVPVDQEGLVVAEIPPQAILVYVTPSHQFPTGVVMSLRRRVELLGWADAHNGLIVEDDYDSEFRFRDRPLEPLQSMDRIGRVIYVGTFSKTLLPGLRIGFLIAPRTLRGALLDARFLADGHGDRVTQGALARLIDGGGFASHLRRARRQYAARREAILRGIDDELAGLLTPYPSSAGLHLAVDLDGATSGAATRTRLAAAVSGVSVQTLGRFYAVAPEREGLVLGFGAIQPDQIGDGLRLLAAATRHGAA